MSVPTATRTSSPPTNTWSRKRRSRSSALPMMTPAKSATHAQSSTADAPPGTVSATAAARATESAARRAHRARHAQGFECRKARSLAPLSLVLPTLLRQHGPDGDEDEVEDQYLRALAVGRPDVPLEDRIREREHRREDENGESLTHPV